MNKVCQTFIGYPSDDELIYMTQTKAKFDEYTLFSDTLEGATPLREIENYVTLTPENEYLYSMCRNPKERNDILRLCFLMYNPDYWYLDCDAIITEFPVIETNRPYFAEFRDKVDGFIIFGNNNSGIFKMILADTYHLVKKGVPVYLAQHRALKNQPISIPKRYFKHKGL